VDRLKVVIEPFAQLAVLVELGADVALFYLTWKTATLPNSGNKNHAPTATITEFPIHITRRSALCACSWQEVA
jgi:hypothetical protein